MLKKCISNTESILSIEGLGVKDNLSYEKVSVQILDRQVKKLRNKEVVFIIVMEKSISWEWYMGGRGRYEIQLSSYFWELRLAILFNYIIMTRLCGFLIFWWSFSHYTFLKEYSEVTVVLLLKTWNFGFCFHSVMLCILICWVFVKWYVACW